MVEINPVLVEVERSGFVESRHRGCAAGLDAGGAVAVRLGAPEEPIFPRSANKPLQAVAMLRSGLDLDDQPLALAAGSHSGEDFHVEGAEKILAGAGLSAEALRCPPQWPLDRAVAMEAARGGSGKSRLRMNCSGKHAAMLATCVAAGWPTESYLDVDHPLQAAVRTAVEDLSGERAVTVGVDGCGAPLFAVSVTGVARAFRALVLAAPGSPERRIADAMRAHPHWTSGTRREECRLMDAVPGLLVKCGAEGVDAFALADGRAGVVKIDDGAMRARTPVTVALLRALGGGTVEGTDQAVLEELSTVPLYGGEQQVGAIRPAPGVF
ncbi:asparaginase [Actinomadura sp. 9N407]|uniref:asparaginase n=1 Tax=Actinomadura sp. 9N407 TaxID=3375154 RepID=UPI0037A092F3